MMSAQLNRWIFVLAAALSIGAAGPGHVPGQAAGRGDKQAASPRSPGRVQVLRSIAAVPPEIVGELREPIAYVQAQSGRYFILDRRGHGVYALDRERTGAWRVVPVGAERGHIIEPVGLGLDPVLGNFVVVDMPGTRPRLQRFEPGGTTLGGFYLPGSGTAPMTISGVTVSGPGAFAYVRQTLLVSAPESGALVNVHGMAGEPLGSYGTLRPTGQEGNPEVHRALNAGIPVPTPDGGIFFVFQCGVPSFRKYDADGRLQFERHIEGPEVDPVVQALPTTWPRKKTEEGREVPLVVPSVRAAAVDRAGNLWVSLIVPYTYVYNAQGERIRIVQFRGAGIISPASLFFTNDGRLLVTPGCYEFRP